MPPSQLPEGGSIPQELDGLVMRSLAKDPDDRFQSAEEMRGLVQYALQMLQDQGPNTGTWNTGPVTMALPHGQPGGAPTSAMGAAQNGGPRQQYPSHATTSQFQQPMVPPLNPDDGTAFPGGGNHGGGQGGHGGYDHYDNGRRGGAWKAWLFAVLAVLAIAGGAAYAIKTGNLGVGGGGNKPKSSTSSPAPSQSSDSTPDTPSTSPSPETGSHNEETTRPTAPRTKSTPSTTPSTPSTPSTSPKTTPPVEPSTKPTPPTDPPTKPTTPTGGGSPANVD